MEFKLVKIGNQIWMADNLDVDTYRNGDPIPEVTDTDEWDRLTTGAWCYYNNDPEMGKLYGKLYNWYALVDPRGLAPEGFRIASDDDWKLLLQTVGGHLTAGAILKSTELWKAPNEGATNQAGFSAKPGGLCDDECSFMDRGTIGYWWTPDEEGKKLAWSYIMEYDNDHVNRSYYEKKDGLSVRCLKA
jgi:uncharacterized protein (TIGR02145 family)